MIIEIEKSFFKKFYAFLAKECAVSVQEDADMYIYDLSEVPSRYRQRALKKLMTERVLPAIALYKALIARSFSEQETLDLLERYAKREEQRMLRRYASKGKLSRALGMYKGTIYRLFAKRKDGWEKIWAVNGAKQSRCTVTLCPIVSVLREYDCGSLAPLFCRQETERYKSLHGAGYFSCAHSIGRGDGFCDFVFEMQK